jgi:hypothetical protein
VLADAEDAVVEPIDGVEPVPGANGQRE